MLHCDPDPKRPKYVFCGWTLKWVSVLFSADFGVSAKNKKTLQKRATFIGTPYWYEIDVCLR